MIHLEDSQLELVKTILKQHIPHKKVLAFGSRVKGNYRTHSDLDLCVIGDSKMSLSELANLREAFSNSDLPIKIDIVDWQDISKEFQAIIESSHEGLNFTENM